MYNDSDRVLNDFFVDTFFVNGGVSAIRILIVMRPQDQNPARILTLL